MWITFCEICICMGYFLKLKMQGKCTIILCNNVCYFIGSNTFNTLFFFSFFFFSYGGGCGEARSGETSKWSSLKSCAGLLLWSGDSAQSASGFLMSCGSLRNLKGGTENRQRPWMRMLGFGKRQKENNKKERQRGPEEEFLSSLLFDDVQLVVVPESTGHLLIRHIVSVL